MLSLAGYIVLLVLVWTRVSAATYFCDYGIIGVDRLTVEYSEQPLGVQNKSPRFAWIISSPKSIAGQVKIL